LEKVAARVPEAAQKKHIILSCAALKISSAHAGCLGTSGVKADVPTSNDVKVSPVKL